MEQEKSTRKLLLNWDFSFFFFFFLKILFSIASFYKIHLDTKSSWAIQKKEKKDIEFINLQSAPKFPHLEWHLICKSYLVACIFPKNMNPIGYIEASHKANLRKYTVINMLWRIKSDKHVLVPKGAHFLEDICSICNFILVQNHITVSV